jgi:RND family efflux transporter MFP subunit
VKRLLCTWAVVALLGCDAAEPTKLSSPAAATAGERAEPVLAVPIDRVRRGSILQRIPAPASLVAKRESRIGPEVSGPIAEIFVAEGDRVEAGDRLFQIDPEPYALGVRQAEARLTRMRAEARQIASDLSRAEELHRSDVLSQQELDKLQTALTVARAGAREAEEALAIARRNLDRTLVRAPYAGSIAARLADEGTTALVQPQTIVIVIQETAELEAQATIPEVHAGAIAVGDPAVLHVEGIPEPIPTEVAAVSDSVDPVTRTYLVRMRVPNEDRRLKAGVFARVDILPRAKSDVLLVPRSALRREDGRTYVMAVRDGRAVSVPVELGVVSEDAAEVLRGLRVDEEIVVGDAAASIGPGTRLEPASERGS